MERKSSSRDEKPALSQYMLDTPQPFTDHPSVDMNELQSMNALRSSHRRVSTSSRDTMQRSLSPSEVFIDTSRTKTGRISKATKGRPVHHCECGKTYTRAEHLRRHQQNHKPGAFPCDVAGCDRAFYREDLLARHKVKYHDADTLPLHATEQVSEPPKSLSSAPLSSLAPLPVSYEITPSAMNSDYILSVERRQTAQHPAVMSNRKGYLPVTELRVPPSIEIATAAAATNGPFAALSGELWDSSSYQSFQSTYNTPEPHYQQYDLAQIPTTVDFGQLWPMTALNPYESSSPISMESATALQPLRARMSGHDSFENFASGLSDEDLMDQTPDPNDPFMLVLPSTETVVLPEIRDLLEQDDLVTPTSVSQAADFGPNQCHHRIDNEQRYLDQYWETLHPVWPVLHKPSFNMPYTSPLLRASMLALGAQSTGVLVDAGNASILHRRCLKVLQKRTVNNQHSYRTCDVQAILLIQIFSAFRSRRQPFHLSQYFIDAYQTLAREVELDVAEIPYTQLNYFDQSQHDPDKIFDIESRQRLLLSYYLIDQQHAFLFGRQKIRTSEGLHAILYYPRQLSAWDSSFTPYLANDSVFQDSTLAPRPTLQQASEEPYLHDTVNDLDVPELFTSTLFTTYMADINDEIDRDTQRASPRIPIHPAASCPLVELSSQTLGLCKATPIRALLAVAGESWVMGEKLTSDLEYSAAKQEVRQWASDKTASNKALTHALRILRLHRVHHKSPLLFHEWSLHLATLVIWACSYASRDSSARLLRLSIPLSNASEPVARSDQLDDAVRKLSLMEDSGSKIAWPEAKSLLMWAAPRMEKSTITRFCGVVSGAVDVLRRLLAMGNEDGWF